MHSQSTHTPHSQHLQSNSYLESGGKSVMMHFCGNSLHDETIAIDCFYRGALSLMFDGVLNDRVLPEKNVSTTGVTQGNLELLLHPNYFDSHQIQIQ